MTYSEKLRDPRWQKKRLKIMERDEFKCRLCGSGDKTLNVHHAYYRPKANPWDYPDEELTTLCEECHEVVGDIYETIGTILPSHSVFSTAYGQLTEVFRGSDPLLSLQIATVIRTMVDYPQSREILSGHAISFMEPSEVAK